MCSTNCFINRKLMAENCQGVFTLTLTLFQFAVFLIRIAEVTYSD